jgi:Domain of unknown function (DUF4159)
MRLRTAILLILAAFATWGVLLAQRPFRTYEGGEDLNVPLPADWDRPADFTRARLKYRKSGFEHPYPNQTGQWGWMTDYPLCDRHTLAGLRRLTLLDTKSVEQVVELDNSDDIYNWPFLYGVEVGHWTLNDEEADQLREYLLRGGFFMTDDFHGTLEWAEFMKSMRKVFPNRPPVDIPNQDPIFHVLYDLDDRTRIPGYQYLVTGVPWEFDGFDPQWRAIYDDHGRVMVAICHNMDLGDAIENSDDPRYPEKFADMAYRVTTNYVMYDLTH